MPPGPVDRSILAPWANERALTGIDDQLANKVNAVCVIGWVEGKHDTWIAGRGARDLRQPGQPQQQPTLDPVVEVAMQHAMAAINHNNPLSRPKTRHG